MFMRSNGMKTAGRALFFAVLLSGVAGGAAASTIEAQCDAAAGSQSLAIGLIWWSIGMAIAIGYFILVYTLFKGKVRRQHGH